LLLSARWPICGFFAASSPLCAFIADTLPLLFSPP
jgi:hypothetical protein